MSATATILAIDTLIGLMSSAQKLTSVIQQAKVAGREVDMDDLNALLAESNEARSRFDEAVRNR